MINKKYNKPIVLSLTTALMIQAVLPNTIIQTYASATVQEQTQEQVQEAQIGVTEEIDAVVVPDAQMEYMQEQYDIAVMSTVDQRVLDGEYVRLTDIPIDYSKSFVESGYGLIENRNNLGSFITLRVDDMIRTFEYGVSAWATSEVFYDISKYSQDFDYLTAYVGSEYHNTTDYLNLGAYMFISTSTDGVTWERQYSSSLKTSFNNADFVKIPISGVNYIKLEGDKNGSSWWSNYYDEVCFADPKLIKESYVDDTYVDPGLITVEELDAKIKAYDIDKTNDQAYQLMTMQRTLIAKAGYTDLDYYLGTDTDFKKAFEWIFDDYENLKDYMLGGDPDGNYMSALLVWRDLYKEFYNDLYDTGSDSRVKYAELYKTMLFTLSLTHSVRVGHWLYNMSYKEPTTSNSSYANERYSIFKKLYHADLLDNTIFPYLEIEEMRFVMNNIIDDESIEWLNWYITDSAQKGISKYHHVAYLSGYNYWDEKYYSDENYDYWDEKYNFDMYGMAYDPIYPKNWVVYEEGAVCGGISKTGSNHEGVFGVPSSVVSQPGHAAYIDYRLNSDGDAYWTVLNNLSGWQQSGRTEKLATRMPNGWGDGSYARNYPASYIFLTQDSMNNFDDYEKSQLVLFQVETFADDLTRLESIYNESLSYYDKNFNSWLGLTYLYTENEIKSEEELMDLINDIGNTLQYFPYPCHDLLAILETHLSTPNYQLIYTMLVEKWITAAEEVTEEESIQATEVKI